MSSESDGRNERFPEFVSISPNDAAWTVRTVTESTRVWVQFDDGTRIALEEYLANKAHYDEIIGETIFGGDTDIR